MATKAPLFKRILIPVDGSPYSLSAVRLGGKLAAVHNSHIWLLHVIDDEVMAQLRRLKSVRNADLESSMESTLVEEARGLVANMKGELKGMGIEAAAFIEKGTPHEIILNLAEELDIDLIVMGKLGRRGVKRILLGSVAERVIEFASCPILLYPGR